MDISLFSPNLSNPDLMRSASEIRKAKDLNQAKKAAEEYTTQFLSMIFKDLFPESTTASLFGEGHMAETFIKPEFIKSIARACARSQGGMGMNDITLNGILNNSGLKDKKLGGHYDRRI